jgi:hypothetical protein
MDITNARAVEPMKLKCGHFVDGKAHPAIVTAKIQ